MRALSQCLAREFQPVGVHVAHVIIDGVIGAPRFVRNLNLLIFLKIEQPEFSLTVCLTLLRFLMYEILQSLCYFFP